MSTPSSEDPETAGQAENTETPPDGRGGISDDQLPEDLRPSDDNPLAKGPGEDDDDDEGGQPEGEPSPAVPPAPNA